MDQYIGKFLDNRYEILEQIGNGGMAMVYKAKCHRLNRMVAVKILRENLMMDDDIRRRFHDEAQAVAMLSSPNIVAVYDVGQIEGADYIVMELIEGITLKEYMEKRGSQLSWQEALHFMTQIMQALRHAHSKGIVHRDIKPQNIMVLRDGSVKVADFGIARLMDSQKTLTQEAFGSVHYVSPEQAKGIRVDNRSDIYSAGVVLYEMLTNQLPFDGDTPVSIALQHINSIPVAPRELNPELPVGMEQICKKALCARLDLRYPDAQAVLNDLEALRRDPEIVFPYDDPWNPGKGPAVKQPPRPARTEQETARYNVPGSQTAQREDELEEQEERSRAKKNKAIATGAVVAVVAVIFGLLFMLYQNFLTRILSPSEVHEVPSVVNMTIDEAKETIATSYGGYFEVVCTKAQFDDSVEAGRIISQSPEGGSSAKGDLTEIKVIISSGIQEDNSTLMPTLTHQDYRTAEAMLVNDYHVVVEYAERVFSDTITEGQIVSTDPIAGTPLTEGQTVTLYVSKGPENKKVLMPLLIGMDEDQAREAAEQVGLEIGSVITVESAEPEGKVIYQSITEYKEISVGDVVYLQISDGSGNQSSTEEATEAPTEAPEDNTEGDGLVSLPTEPLPEEQVVEPVYQISVPISKDALTDDMLDPDGDGQDADVIVTIQVNGETVLNMPVSLDSREVSSVYRGEIDDVLVLINGVATRNFTCTDISGA